MTGVESSDKVVYLTVPSDYAGQRIDNFLHTKLKGVPKSHIYRILRKGEVRVNKGRIAANYRLQADDIIRIPPIRCSQNEYIAPQDKFLAQLQAAIVHQDKQLLVINKPSGIAVHGGSGVSYGIIEGLRALYPHETQLELVHRLDRDTSGCLLVAKKRAMLHQLHDLLRDNAMIKHYVALVSGKWEHDYKQVEVPLRKNVLRSGERLVQVDRINGKPACTKFRLIEQFSYSSLLEAELITGRTHQIRVHCAHVKHPIAGDEKYGFDEFNKIMKNNGLQRLFLHAQRVEINLPDYKLHIQADLPPDLSQILRQL
jgi:23S rRNA pseudouridine955/2504/2580 synthase